MENHVSINTKNQDVLLERILSVHYLEAVVTEWPM